MNTIKTLLISCLIALGIFPSFATAALVWDFDLVGPDLNGMGQFTVSANSPGTLDTFTFSGEVFQHPFSVGLGDVNSADWSIAGNSLTSLQIDTNDVSTGTLGVFASLSLRSPNPSSSVCQDLDAGVLCDTSNLAVGFATSQSFTLQPAPVPIPGTALLMAPAILGLSGYRWHQRRREETQAG